MSSNVEAPFRSNNLDRHLEPCLRWVKDRTPRTWVNADMITITRITIGLPLYIVSLYFCPALLGVWCVWDYVTDLTDGPWARLFGKNPLFGRWHLEHLGGFLDSSSDKISNWTRLGLLIFATPIAPIADATAAGHSIFWLVVGISFFPDLTNFTIRLAALTQGRIKDSDATKNGKVKAWCQGIGITLLSLIYAGQISDGGVEQWLFVFSLLLNSVVLIAIIPEREGNRRWNNYWRPVIRVACGLVALLTYIQATKPAIILLAQIALSAAVYFSVRSTADQILRLRRR